MEDYKEIIKEMLLRDFSPNIPVPVGFPLQRGIKGDVIKMTTLEILKMVQGIIPQSPINEHDIFEVLKEIGFQYKLVGMEHITDDKELILYEYRWILWKKDVDL